MAATKNRKQIIKFYKKHFAKMVHAFILKATYKSPDEVKIIYDSFSKEWDKTVRKVNARYGFGVLSFDAWDREWKQNGYSKYITIPVPKQLPEEEKKKLISQKRELLRIVKIVEGKTEHQWQRRELVYKVIFLKIRIKHWFKSIFSNLKKQPASVV